MSIHVTNEPSLRRPGYHYEQGPRGVWIGRPSDDQLPTGPAPFPRTRGVLYLAGLLLLFAIILNMCMTALP